MPEMIFLYLFRKLFHGRWGRHREKERRWRFLNCRDGRKLRVHARRAVTSERLPAQTKVPARYRCRLKARSGRGAVCPHGIRDLMQEPDKNFEAICGFLGTISSPASNLPLSQDGNNGALFRVHKACCAGRPYYGGREVFCRQEP